MKSRSRLVIVLAFALLVTSAPAPLVSARETPFREVTLALRVEPLTNKPLEVRVAVPVSDREQVVTPPSVRARGMEIIPMLTDAHPHILLRGRLKKARRVAVTFRVQRDPRRRSLPAITPVGDPPADLLPFLTPAPLFQSRSILVREFLETHVAPQLGSPQVGLVEAIRAATRERLHYRPDGRSLALDVIRRGEGKRIGIERAFTSFLRCAGLPARFVEGINLRSRTKKKRVFWTELWFDGSWWPVSASGGWSGTQPAHYVALARDGTRVVKSDQNAMVTYTVQSRKVKSLEAAAKRGDSTL